jgi:hypothetical protein
VFSVHFVANIGQTSQNPKQKKFHRFACSVSKNDLCLSMNVDDKTLESGTPTKHFRKSVVDPIAAQEAERQYAEQRAALLANLKRATEFLRRQKGQGFEKNRCQAIREKIAQGIVKPREIVKALADERITVSKALIARVKAREKEKGTHE